jgi:hypothetical protein
MHTYLHINKMFSWKKLKQSEKRAKIFSLFFPHKEMDRFPVPLVLKWNKFNAIIGKRRFAVPPALCFCTVFWRGSIARVLVYKLSKPFTSNMKDLIYRWQLFVLEWPCRRRTESNIVLRQMAWCPPYPLREISISKTSNIKSALRRQTWMAEAEQKANIG